MATGSSIKQEEAGGLESSESPTESSIPLFPAFNPVSARWQTYRDRLVFHFAAHNVRTKRWKACMLTWIGDETYTLLESLILPRSLQDTSVTVEELIQLLNTYYSDSKHVMTASYDFWSCKQAPGQPIAAFIAALKDKARHCAFDTSLLKEKPFERALRDALLIGVQDVKIRAALLKLTDPSWQDTAKAALDAERLSKELQHISEAQSDARPLSSAELSINQIQKKGHQQKGRRKGQPVSQPPAGGNKGPHCQSCGRTDHQRHDCRFRDTICNYCHKKGHIEAACRAKQKPSSSRPGQKNQRVTCVQMNRVETEAPPLSVLTKMEGIPVEMEFDCGAGVSIIPRSIWKKIKKPPLHPTSTRCFTYTGDEIPIDGEANVTVAINERTARVPVLITPSSAPIMGRSWFAPFDIDLRKSFTHLKKEGNNAVNAIATKPPADKSLELLLNDYPEVFAEGLGYCKKLKASLQLKDDAKPVFIKARPLPLALKPKVEKEFKRLQDLQVVSPVDYSDWAAPIVVAPKPGGKLRICADFSTGLNKQLDLHHHPLPRTQDLLASLGKNAYYTKIDFSDAYLQIELDDEAKKLVVVSTHKGLYRYNRLPFGVSSAPGIFQKTMDTMLQGIEGVHAYIDDIIIVGRTKEEHRVRLKSVLNRIKDFGFHVRRDKCSFEKSKIVYLGFIIDKDGIRADPKKIAAITDMPVPQDVKSLKAFLGMVNHYHRFIPNLADLEQPLTHLTSAKTPWKWSKVCNKAFCDIKKILSGPLVVGHYTPDDEIVVAADASAYGIGARIYHRYANGQEKVIAYASKKLDAAQKNYGQIEKEALALVFAIDKFHQYLFGREFTLLTDHKPLVTIFGDKKGVPVTAASRLQRWAIKLLGYTFKIEYRRTEDFGQVDGLSRLPASDDKEFDSKNNRKDVKLYRVVAETQEAFRPVSAADVLRETVKDKTLQRVKQAIDHGWPARPDAALQPYFKYRHDLSVIKGCICWGARTVIPPSLHARVLHSLHQTHPGIVAMKSIARQHCWWPCISEDIAAHVRNCPRCTEAQKAPPKVPPAPWPPAHRPMERVHVDYADYKGRSLLLFIDAYSKWLEVILLNSTTSTATIAALYNHVFSAFGYPQLIVSDNGRQFASEEFASFCLAHGIKHLFSPPYHPQSNGQVEREVDSVKRALLKQELEGGSLEDKLLAFLMRYRSTPLASNGHSPAELFLGRSIRTDLHQLYPSSLTPSPRQQEMEKGFHQKAKNRQFKVGDRVLIKDNRPNQQGKWRKGQIVRQMGRVCYEVQIDGHLHTCHANQLRPDRSSSHSIDEGLLIDLSSDGPRVQQDDHITEHPTLSTGPEKGPDDNRAVTPDFAFPPDATVDLSATAADLTALTKPQTPAPRRSPRDNKGIAPDRFQPYPWKK